MTLMLDITNHNVKHIQQICIDNVRMALQDRINELLAEFPAKKKADLARFVGVSRTTPTDWTSGKTKKIDGDHAYLVADFFDAKIEPYWVLTGEGPKYRSNTIPKPPIESNAVMLGGFDLWDENTPLDEDEVALPFFKEVEVSAGSGRTEVIENGGRHLRFAKSTLQREGVLEHNAACVNVSGNSMEPVLTDGTTIGVDKSVTKIVDGEMYAIDQDGHLRVKLLYRLPGGGIRLRSYNREEYPDEILTPDEAKTLRVIGWVFWISTLRKRRFS